MNRIYFSILIVFIMSANILLAQGSKLALNSSYQMKIGDYAALMISELLKMHSDLDAPVIAIYEPDPNTIDVEILGGRGSAEGAKETIQNYLQFLHTSHIPYVTRRFGVTLSDQDYRILYYDRTARGGSKLILQYVKGQYTLPQ